MNTRRAWLVYGIGVFAYLIAITQRSSLGVAGVVAAERFEIAAAALSTLAIVQLVVYAGLQVPVGMMIDRVGPKRLLVIGAGLMCVGQATLALSPVFIGAAAGRLLVGAGDAMTFISVTRLIVSWFSGRYIPQLTQWLGTLGQFGQIISAVPLAFAIRDLGWSPAFLSAAGLSVLAGVLLIVWMKDSPSGEADAAERPSTRVQLREFWVGIRRPGTRYGFWTHFMMQSPSNTISLLWGFPLFSVGLGYGPAVASTLLVAMVIAGAVSGPLIGLASSRYPLRRGVLSVTLLAVMFAAIAVLLLWPGIPPVWVTLIVVMTLAGGGPASLVGMDIARAYNPLRSLGAVLGLVNVGGFVATTLVLLGVGLVLDLLDRLAGGSGVSSELYAFDRFRIALLIIPLVATAGATLMMLARNATRRDLDARGLTLDPRTGAVIPR